MGRAASSKVRRVCVLIGKRGDLLLFNLLVVEVLLILLPARTRCRRLVWSVPGCGPIFGGTGRKAYHCGEELMARAKGAWWIFEEECRSF